MGRKNTKIESLYGLSIKDLNKIANESKSSYTRGLIQAVILRYNDVPTSTIVKTLGKSKATVVSYINKWNTKGIVAISDQRGGNVKSKITDEIAEDVKNIITNKSPHDFGYEQNKWNSLLLARYIEDKYGYKYSKVWMTKLLKSLGFSYKRGVYKPTLGNPELQSSFKKNDPFDGYY